MPYLLTDNNKKTFKAIKFNKQYFAIGRGLFIHLQKYWPDVIKRMQTDSKSKYPLTLKRFTAATRGFATYYRGLKFEYADLDKSHREELKKYSAVGEGWWPTRSIPKTTREMDFTDFANNYEKAPEYIRRLGKGLNINGEDRIRFQDGIEYTGKGYENMIAAFDKIQGNLLRGYMKQFTPVGYYRVRIFTGRDVIPAVEFCDWYVWTIKDEKMRREVLRENGYNEIY